MNFPPLFRSLHSSLFIAFHCLLSPFITFHRRPISLSAHSLLSPVLSSPRPILSSPCPVLSSPRPALSPCPRIPPLHTCFHPASSPPFVSRIRLSRTIVCAPLFCFPLLYSFPLFCVLCFTSSPFALLTPLFYTALLYSLPLFTPPSLYLLPLFCTRFFTPRQPPQTRPRHRKRQRFSHFSKKFCKKPLTKQKKVIY